jgi:hypothetical protein
MEDDLDGPDKHTYVVGMDEENRKLVKEKLTEYSNHFYIEDFLSWIHWTTKDGPADTFLNQLKSDSLIVEWGEDRPMKIGSW